MKLRLTQAFSENRKPDAASMTEALLLRRYPEARALAEQNLTLRLVYDAMREGFFEAGTHLVLRNATGQETVLRNADALYDYLYTRRGAEHGSLALRRNGVDEKIGDIDFFVNHTLRAAAIKQLPGAADETKWKNFTYEIYDSLRHETLAMAAALQFKADLAPEAAASGGNMWNWMNAEDSRQWLSAHNHDIDSFLLQLSAFHGHPVHPASKMRLLLNIEKGERYPVSAQAAQKFFPEFGPDVALKLYAVRRDKMTVSLSNDGGPEQYMAHLTQAFPGALARWRAELAKTGAAAEDYLPIPVHPLQTGIVAERFAEAMRDGEVIALPQATLDLRPTLSTRTLTPVEGHGHAQVKVPINMQMTSIIRTLAPSRVFNTPVYSDLVRDIVAEDPRLAGFLRPLEERAAAYYGHDPRLKSPEYMLGYQLSAVFKQDPADRTAADELRVPVAALLHESPFSGKPVIADIMQSAGITNAAEASAYFADYARTVVEAEVGILSRYGVGLEGHQQNDDMIFSRVTARPKSVMYRDISGGIECSEPLLKLNGYDVAPHIHPVKKCLYDDLSLPLEQTTHTTFYSHLFPLVAIVAREFGASQAELYGHIRDAVKQTLDYAEKQHLPRLLGKLPAEKRRAAEKEYRENLRVIRHDLLSADMETKCLLRMRIDGTQHMEFRPARNPLAVRRAPQP